MENEANTFIQIAKIITGFLSDNIIYILILTLIIICRNAISDLIKRLTNLRWKRGSSELEEKAAAPTQKTEATTLEKTDEPPIEANDDKEIAIKGEEVQEQKWYSKMHIAFKEGRIDDAKDAFNDYAPTEEDPLKLQNNKGFFLYSLFTKGKDNSAIEQLKTLVNTSTDEESKHDALIWLSFCFDHSSQTEEEIKLWKESINSFSSEIIITDASIRLARALNRAGNASDAKNLLVSRLKSVSISGDKAGIYSALSRIEKSLDNKRLAIYCKDKYLELNPNNRDEIFNVAYQAAEEDVNDLSISNYINLLRIDANNKGALNNLGVIAQNAKLPVKAVEKYIESSSFDNTLAMSNRGYLLANAGFLEEAKVLAKEALKLENPHENLYRLLTKISDLQKEQDTEWDKLVSKSIERQKFIRNYTDAHYEGDNKFDGVWETENGNTITINIEDDKLEATWQEPSLAGILSSSSSVKCNMVLTGKVNNSAFLGRYKRNVESGQSPPTLLGSSIDPGVACIGLLSNDGSVFRLISDNHSDDFSLELKRINTQQGNSADS